MSEYNFHFPQRYDAKEAEEGVEFEITDELGQSWGSWTCSLFDKHSPRVQAKIQRFARTHAKAARKGQRDNALAAVFVDVCVHDWKMKDAKGKEIPFTKEAAIAYLTMEEASYAVEVLIALASDPLNFQGVPEADADADLGNSENS